jgi:hypothetical protein
MTDISVAPLIWVVLVLAASLLVWLVWTTPNDRE